jgi:uncharacterized protein YggE
MKVYRVLCLCVVGSLALSPARPFAAAENKRLAVMGTGRIEVRPDVMELSATVVGSAELTSDALKKFRDNKRRGIDAIRKLKVEGLQVKEGGISVLSNASIQQYQQRFGGNAQQLPPGQTTFSETLTFVVPGVDRVADEKVQDLATKILDAAKDAGLTMGQSFDPYRRYYDSNSYRPEIVSFRVEKPDDVRQKALDLAAQDARKKAEQMAKRLGISLGQAISARDSSQPFTINQPNYPVQYSQHATANTSSTLHDIPIDATLLIEYEILN